MDFFTALRALSTFDHDACNTQLVARHIALSHPRFRDGGLGAYEPSPIDLLMVLFLVGVVWLSIWTYWNRKTYRGTFRNYYYIGPILVVFSLFILHISEQMTIEYAQTCTALLHAGS